MKNTKFYNEKGELVPQKKSGVQLEHYYLRGYGCPMHGIDYDNKEFVKTVGGVNYYDCWNNGSEDHFLCSGKVVEKVKTVFEFFYDKGDCEKARKQPEDFFSVKHITTDQNSTSWFLAERENGDVLVYSGTKGTEFNN
jgi:hypothetical protein